MEQARSAESRAEWGEIKGMKTEQNDPKEMAAALLLLSREDVSAKCRGLNITPTESKSKMIDRIIVSVFGLDACKRAFARRS